MNLKKLIVTGSAVALMLSSAAPVMPKLKPNPQLWLMSRLVAVARKTMALMVMGKVAMIIWQ
ncbi:MAG: hypothetical protein UW86_C0031G0005 [Microgenomates group bacterium GW2011_GWA1_Microgenomates_45_10]|nr:MAG: hypothetical protein UW86_C0031G0005 [Microgenomates group bacterium GW2011_GWA1_Microgenomates_45_10]